MKIKLDLEEVENIRILLGREIKQTETFIRANQNDKYLTETQKIKINEKHQTRFNILRSAETKLTLKIQKVCQQK